MRQPRLRVGLTYDRRADLCGVHKRRTSTQRLGATVRRFPKDDLRSSAGLSTWHSCFVCASDTVAFTGRLVAEPGVAYAHERIG
jgi:hypothetical protein